MSDGDAASSRRACRQQRVSTVHARARVSARNASPAALAPQSPRTSSFANWPSTWHQWHKTSISCCSRLGCLRRACRVFFREYRLLRQGRLRALRRDWALRCGPCEWSEVREKCGGGDVMQDGGAYTCCCAPFAVDMAHLRVPSLLTLPIAAASPLMPVPRTNSSLS